jgi:hypothetical protein
MSTYLDNIGESSSAENVNARLPLFPLALTPTLSLFHFKGGDTYMVSNSAPSRYWREVGVKFSDQQAFGRFCASLLEDRVAFSLGGNRTIFIAESDLENLPSQSDRLFARLEEEARAAKTPIEVYPADGDEAHEYDPTPEETRQALRRLLGKSPQS